MDESRILPPAFRIPGMEIDENAVNVFLWSQLIIKYQIQTIMSLLLYCHWNDDWHTNKILETKLTWIYIFLEFPCFTLKKFIFQLLYIPRSQVAFLISLYDYFIPNFICIEIYFSSLIFQVQLANKIFNSNQIWQGTDKNSLQLLNARCEWKDFN